MTEPIQRASELLLYPTPSGAVKVSVLFRDETAWLTQKALAALFEVGMPAITKHLKHIFASGELVEDAVVSVLETTASEGKTYKTRFYNLDAIIAVGYRVNSYPHRHPAGERRPWSIDQLEAIRTTARTQGSQGSRPELGGTGRLDSQRQDGDGDVERHRQRSGPLPLPSLD